MIYNLGGVSNLVTELLGSKMKEWIYASKKSDSIDGQKHIRMLVISFSLGRFARAVPFSF